MLRNGVAALARGGRAMLVAVLGVTGCGGDRSRSPACGLAQLAGPTLIQQQLREARAVLTEAPRGLPETLPARVITQQQGAVLVGYDGTQLVMGFQGSGFPLRPGGYGLLAVDDTSQRVQGVLVYESEAPRDYPKLGTVSGGEVTLPLFGVRVDWASVNNPRCPLLGATPPVPDPEAAR